MKQQTTKSKKKNIRPLLLILGIIGFLTIALCIMGGLFKILRNELGEDFPIKQSRTNYFHYAIGPLILACFVIAMVFAGLRNNFSSQHKILTNQVIIIVNAIFWGAALVLAIITALPLLDVDLNVESKIFVPIMWLAIAGLLVPPSVINLISFLKSK